jgi:hypothetical protein
MAPAAQTSPPDDLAAFGPVGVLRTLVSLPDAAPSAGMHRVTANGWPQLHEIARKLLSTRSSVNARSLIVPENGVKLRPVQETSSCTGVSSRNEVGDSENAVCSTPCHGSPTACTVAAGHEPRCETHSLTVNVSNSARP